MKQTQQKCGICLNFYSTRVRNHCPLCGSYKFVENGRIHWRVWNNHQFIPIARVFPFPVHGMLDRVIALSLKIREKQRKESLKAEKAQYKHGQRTLAMERKQKIDKVSNAKDDGEIFIRPVVPIPQSTL